MGKPLIIAGIVLIVAGVLITYTKIGRLPGDIVIRGKNSTFYFPVVSSILISIILSVVMWLLRRR
jgi:hypothetical protein